MQIKINTNQNLSMKEDDRNVTNKNLNPNEYEYLLHKDDLNMKSGYNSFYCRIRIEKKERITCKIYIFFFFSRMI